MGNQNQKREGTKKKRKDKKKKHHAYALIVLILAAAIIILGTVLLFYIQEVEVSGNEYCDSQEIVECVQNDKLSKNSLYVLAKYSLGQGKKPECLDTLKAIGNVAEGLLHVTGSVATESKDEVMQLLAYAKQVSDEAVKQINSTKTSTLSEIKKNSDNALDSIASKHTNAIDDIENAKSAAAVTINNLIDTLGLSVKGGKVCQRIRVK